MKEKQRSLKNVIREQLDANKEIYELMKTEEGQMIIEEQIRKHKEKISNVLKEEEERYFIEEPRQINQPHDKTIKKIFEYKSEAVAFINKVLDLKGKYKLEENDIENYKSNYITEQYAERRMDIIFKITNEDKINGKVFVLIEHQTKTDKEIPWRMHEYVYELTKEIRIKEKTYQIPLVIPIVLYTGEERWNIEENIFYKEGKLLGYRKPNEITYHLEDVNQYNRKELLKSNLLLSKILLLERAEPGEDLEKTYNSIIENEELTKEQLIFILNYITYVNPEGFNKEKVNKIKEKINKNEEGGKSMLAETIKKDYAMRYNKGREEATSKIAKKLKEKGMTIKEIANITDLDETEVKKICS